MASAPGTGPRHDAGAASVLMVAIVAAACLLLGALAVGLNAVLSAARAQTVADLAALAGAEVAVRQLWELTPGNPCGVAGAVVAANGAHLVSCQDVGGGRLTVIVEVDSALGRQSAQALAGPHVAVGLAGSHQATSVAGSHVAAGLAGLQQVTSVAGSHVSPRQMSAVAQPRYLPGSEVTGACASTRSRSTSAPSLSSGELPLPHLGD